MGDATTNIGAFHESLNLAAIWSLPALFVCENNTYAEFTDSRTMSRRPGVAQLGPTYGLLSRQVDGNDVEAVLAAASEACSACRAGQGPFLLEALTYRWQGHYEGDQQAYKPDAEAEAWKARDPLQITRRRVEDAELASRDELDEIMAAAERRIDEALAFARASAFPPIDETYTDVFCD